MMIKISQCPDDEQLETHVYVFKYLNEGNFNKHKNSHLKLR